MRQHAELPVVARPEERRGIHAHEVAIHPSQPQHHLCHGAWCHSGTPFRISRYRPESRLQSLSHVEHREPRFSCHRWRTHFFSYSTSWRPQLRAFRNLSSMCCTHRSLQTGIPSNWNGAGCFAPVEQKCQLFSPWRPRGVLYFTQHQQFLIAHLPFIKKTKGRGCRF